ncbi:MAG: glycoside hydrolase family 2 [Bacteroidales bacterium]|nr:glycoside hydrolase family 2 [Bacteroidales bacterium]
MKRIFFVSSIIFFLFILFSGCSGKEDTNNKIESRYNQPENIEPGFINPPDYARIRSFWWWLNSNVTKDCITKDLESMKANGYGGAIIFDAGSSSYSVALKTPAGPPFLSDKWIKLYQHAIREADRLGLELTINVQSGWNPGGPLVTPEDAMKKITWSETNVKGPGRISVSLPQPPSELYYKDILIQAVRTDKTGKDSLGIKNFKIKTFYERIGWSGIYPLYKLREDYSEECKNPLQKKDIINVTHLYRDGKLEWNVPEGNWTILRYGMTCTGVRVSTASDGWDGLSIDHLNSDALLQYNKDVISKLVFDAQKVGKSLKFIHTDSWEMGVANWTHGFMEKFKALRGYDMSPYMPVLTNRIVVNREISNRFLHDFRRTVSDLISDDFYRTFTEIAHQNNIYTHPESGGPHSAPIDALKTMRYNDVPMGEFWVRSNTHRVTDAQRLCVKQSASVAHIYGKQIVAAEGPTSIGPQWERPPKDCKNVIDQIFCSGVNRIVWHTFTASPDEYGEPGNEYFAGTHLNRHVTWWKQSRSFIEYMNRCSFLLMQGLYVADALYYYGDDTPNFVFLKDEVTDLDFGYDWDKCSMDVIISRIRIENGKIILPDGMKYSMLVLPLERELNLKLLHKLEKLVKEGMILVGPKAEKATGLTGYPRSDRRIKIIADRLWGNIDGTKIKVNNFGKGKVIWGMTATEALKTIGVKPDFGFSGTSNDSKLDYIHRSAGNKEIYFVVNRLARHGINDTQYRYLTDLPDRYEDVVGRFRVTGKVPELWDPMTGEIKRLAVYSEDEEYTYVPLHLPPEASVFIVFREGEYSDHIVGIKKDGKEIFPKVTLPGSCYPVIECFWQNGKTVASISSPGDYSLNWSDGSASFLNEPDTIIKLPVSEPMILKFNMPWGPSEPVKCVSLKSWTEFADKQIKYYSGSADYSSTFYINYSNITGKKICLDLGNVQEVAEVQVNDNYAGVCWIAPFRLDVSKYITPGENKIRITVVNSWVNKLIGDSYLPEDKRVTHANIIKFEGKDRENLLRMSGLIGKVQIIITDQKVVD